MYDGDDDAELVDSDAGGDGLEELAEVGVTTTSGEAWWLAMLSCRLHGSASSCCCSWNRSISRRSALNDFCLAWRLVVNARRCCLLLMCGTVR